MPILTLTWSLSAAAEKSFDKRFDAPPCGRVTLQTDTGSVSVIGHDGRDVVIRAQISGRDADRFAVTAEQNASGITVTGRKQSRGWFEWYNLHVKFTIAVPRDYPIELKTSGGSIEAHHLNASIRGKTSGGNIAVQDVSGAIDMHTSGGRIEAARLDGPGVFDSSGGGISIVDATGDLDVRTSGGEIDLINIDGRVKAGTSGGGIHAEVRGNRGITLTTSGGSITLLLPENVRASVDARTSGGSARSDLALTTADFSDRNRLRGAINGGGDPILLRTSGGRIYIGSLK